jgi:hypothetical protein
LTAEPFLKIVCQVRVGGFPDSGQVLAGDGLSGFSPFGSNEWNSTRQAALMSRLFTDEATPCLAPF